MESRWGRAPSALRAGAWRAASASSEWGAGHGCWLGKRGPASEHHGGVPEVRCTAVIAPPAAALEPHTPLELPPLPVRTCLLRSMAAVPGARTRSTAGAAMAMPLSARSASGASLRMTRAAAPRECGNMRLDSRHKWCLPCCAHACMPACVRSPVAAQAGSPHETQYIVPETQLLTCPHLAWRSPSASS